MGKRTLQIITLIFVCFFITNCNNDHRLTEGKIEYKITYPCLEESNNPMRMFLPKKWLRHLKIIATKTNLFFQQIILNWSY